MPDKRLLILTAVPLEAGAVARALRLRCPRPGESVTGKVAGCEVELAIVGIKAHGLEKLTISMVPTHVLMVGLAGALDPRLNIGDVIVDGSAEGVGSLHWAIGGRICCSDRIVATPADKARLFQESNALAVEMENDRARAWAGSKGARFIAVRAISDRADQSLDPAVLRLVDEWGRVKPLATAWILATRPGLIPQLARLGRDSQRAAKRLGRAVGELVAK